MPTNKIYTSVKFVCDNKLPQAKGLPFIGTMLSLIASGSSKNLQKYVDKRHKQFGPIFKEKIGPASCIFVSSPEAIREVFSNEGKYPVHILPDPWVTYNELHGNSRGLFFMDGEDWWKYRKIMNKIMLKNNFEESCEPIASNFAQEILKVSQKNDHVTDLEKRLFTWSLEMLVSILTGPEAFQKWKPQLGEKIRKLGEDNQNVFLTTSKLSLVSSKLAYKLKIPSWNKFETSVTTSLNGSSSLVQDLLDNFVYPSGLLHQMRNENLTDDEIKRIVIDLVLAAGDTTSYGMEWTLYCLAKHSSIQEKIRSTNPSSTIKNAIKESLRLYPIAPFLTRILPMPLDILGYTIPANNLIVMSIYTSGRDGQIFENPDEFKPERWDRESSEPNKLKKMQMATLPFAMGARSCIGKRIAEAQMKTTLHHILRDNKMILKNEKDVDFILKMVGVPSEPIKISIEPIQP